jgi:hypothetical protein
MRLRRFVTPGLISLALVVAGALPWAPGARAATPPESDIPGITLPGPVVSGQLGGPIYDVVFNLTVPSGYVIAANLTGAPGTLVGLYLFDSTATSVIGTQGLVASSTIAGISQHIAYPVQGGGTYYIDLNGANNVEGAFTLTVQLVPDSTTPTVSLILDGGRAATNAPIVSVSLTTTAGISGVSEMAFSADGQAWDPWQPYAIASSYTFVPGDGPKHLWVKVRSAIGLVSDPAQASILLETVAPTVTAITPAPGSAVGDLRPTLSVTFSEAIDPASWLNLGLVMQAPSGALVAGSYALATRTTGTFTPTTALLPGTPYAVTVGSVTDLAGNRIVPIPSWILLPVLPSAATLTVAPQVVVAGGSTTLAGTVQPAGIPGAQLLVRTATASDFSPASALPAGAGPFSVSLAPTMNSWYRVDVPASPVIAAAQSSVVRVIVRRAVALDGPSASQTRSARPGASVVIRARVAPAAAGVSVSFRLYRFDAGRRAYVFAGSRGAHTTAAGMATIAWTAPAGQFFWQAVVYPTPEFANNISPAYRWLVR